MLISFLTEVNMDVNKNLKSTKKAYIKPEIKEVELVAEQAVLAVCKDNAFSTACLPDPCTNAGSFGS
jgi:hypothetical protein